MKVASLILVLGTAALAASCANESRSRDTANPHVAAATLAEQVCSNCHGVNGQSISPNFPNLAGQREDYIVAQLTGFKGHARVDPAGFQYMWGIAHNLSDAQIKGLAAYYASQAVQAQPIEGTPENIAAGKLIFEHGISSKNVPACATCHGDQAQGNGAFPRLAGQHADYVIKQLGVFQRTDERPEGAVMKVVSHDLGPQDIEAVAAYVQSIQPR